MHFCQERRLCPTDNPVTVQLLWPQATRNDYKFCLRRRRKLPEASLEDDHTPIHIAPGQRQGGLHGISTIDEQVVIVVVVVVVPVVQLFPCCGYVIYHCILCKIPCYIILCILSHYIIHIYIYMCMCVHKYIFTFYCLYIYI